MIQSQLSLLTAAIEMTMNRVLLLDPDYQERLKEISGRTIALVLTDWNIKIYFIADEYQFTVISDYDRETDVLLVGNSWDFFKLGINQHFSTKTVNDSEVRFEGNVVAGQKFAELFSELNIDWEENLAAVTGDIIAHRLSNIARQTGHWLNDILSTSQKNTTEYFQEEIQLTPTKIEVENYFDDLDDLVSDAENLILRFEQCKNFTHLKTDQEYSN